MVAKKVEEEGQRARKLRETRLRIAEEGLRLFDERGYEVTTLEEVAEAAGVSPRTLYHYFETKYQILTFWHDDGFIAAIRPSILAQAKGPGPFAAARASLLEIVPRYESDRQVTTDRIWNSTDSLLAHKQLVYLQYENAISDALAELWPEPSHRLTLRLSAMTAVAVLRLAMDLARRRGEKRSLLARLKECFALLERQGTAAVI